MIITNLKEQTHYGDLMFPFQIYSIDWADKEPFSHLHGHDEIEIIYIRSGKASFLVNGDVFELKEGNALFINSGSLHTRYCLNGTRCQYFAIVFNLNMLSSSTYDVCQNKFIQPLIKRQHILPQVVSACTTWESSILNELDLITENFLSKELAYELYIKASLLRIFSLILRNNKAPSLKAAEISISEHHVDILKKTLVYI